MFPGDAQSVKDLHDLADFMGRNQATAGGIASSMARMRMLGLKEAALSLIGSVKGFSWLMTSPRFARAMLNIMSAGKNVVKASAAIGVINHAANVFQEGGLDTPPRPNETPENSTPPAQHSTSSTIPKGRVPVVIPQTSKVYHFPSPEAAAAFKKAAGLTN